MRISDLSSDVCSSDLVSWQTKSADWIRDRKIRFILQIGLKKHPEEPDVPLLLDLVKDPEMKRIVEFMSVPTQVGRSVSSAERRVGPECVSTCSYRWSRDP